MIEESGYGRRTNGSGWLKSIRIGSATLLRTKWRTGHAARALSLWGSVPEGGQTDEQPGFLAAVPLAGVHPQRPRQRFQRITNKARPLAYRFQSFM